MTSPNFEAVDRQLADLGAVPPAARLAELVARHAAESVTLQNVDALLDALGTPIALPPRLQPTAVDTAAPALAAEEAHALDEVLASADELEAQAIASMSAVAPASVPARARMPWESEPAESSAAAQAIAASVSARPAPLPDLESLFSDEPPPPRPSSIMPAEPPVQQPRKRHDTIEQMPSVSPRLASLQALDLSELGMPPAPNAPSEAEATQSDAAAAQVPVLEDDEFEILVDDEILEIDDET